MYLGILSEEGSKNVKEVTLAYKIDFIGLQSNENKMNSFRNIYQGAFKPTEKFKVILLPSKYFAQELLHCEELDGKYYIGTLFYDIPVVVTERTEVIGFLLNQQNPFNVFQRCLVLDHDLSFPVYLTLEIDEWLKWFDSTNVDEICKILDLDIPATEFLKERKITLYTEPTPDMWTALCIFYYILYKCPLIYPNFYPTVIELTQS